MRGLLISALYQPVFVSAIFNSIDMAIVLIGVYLLKRQKLPIMWLVILFAVIGVLLKLIWV